MGVVVNSGVDVSMGWLGSGVVVENGVLFARLVCGVVVGNSVLFAWLACGVVAGNIVLFASRGGSGEVAKIAVGVRIIIADIRSARVRDRVRPRVRPCHFLVFIVCFPSLIFKLRVY